MKKPDFNKGWAAFVHWKGWKNTASAFKKAWHATIHWAGWNILFGLPFFLVLLLGIACAGGLIWVFVHNRTSGFQPISCTHYRPIPWLLFV